MSFDVQGARRAGYTDAEIAAHLAQERNFDLPGARNAGYSDSAILQHLAETPQMREARRANSGVGGYVDSLVRQGAQGATFGLADELIAGLRTGAGLWGNYGEALGQERARDAAFRQDNPVAAALANVAGAVVSPAARVGLIRQGVQAGAGMGRALLSGAGRGAVAGATGGALAGAGEGEGVSGRVAGAAEGALTGGVFGGALGAGVSAAAPVAGRVLDYAGLRNPGVAADRQILRAAERDMAGNGGVDPVAAARPRSVDGQTLIDRLGGRNVVNLAGTVANTPGAGMEAADQLVQMRRAARPERIAGAVDDALGGGGGTRVPDEVAALRQQRSTQAAPLYDAAFSRDAPDTPTLRRIMSQPVVQRATADQLRLQQMEAVARGEAFEPNAMRMLDAAKRGLDEQIGATLDPVTQRVIPGRGAENRALSELRDALLREVDAVPEYAAARAAWAGPTQSMQAMADGQSALRMNPDVVQQIAARLPPSDLEFFRLGVGRAITDSAADPARAATAARRLLEDRSMQRRLEAAIPDPAQRAQFAAALQREVNMASVDQAISPRAGSQTARMQAGGEDMGRDPPGGALASLLMGRTMEGLRQGAAGFYRATQGINSKTADALAERLMATDPAQQHATLARLMRQREADRLAAMARAGLGQQLLRGLGAGATLSTGD